MSEQREGFLMHVYDQMFANINRHVTAVWQAIGVLVGAIIALLAAKFDAISLDGAVVLGIALAGWMLAHTLDASNWFNRNIAIISNIERQFLRNSDVSEIHPFWQHAHRTDMSTHLRIQAWFAGFLWLFLLAVHLLRREWGSLATPFEFSLAIAPYLFSCFVLFLLGKLREHCKKKDTSFANNSPGKVIE